MRDQYKLNKYNVNDIVYYVNDFRVVKSIVDEVVIKSDKDGTHVLYLLSPYNKDGKSKGVNCVEAFIVDNLSLAKESALTNWRRITQEVQSSIENLTEKSFEPLKNDE
jgi:hypothetical protein